MMLRRGGGGASHDFFVSINLGGGNRRGGETKISLRIFRCHQQRQKASSLTCGVYTHIIRARTPRAFGIQVRSQCESSVASWTWTCEGERAGAPTNSSEVKIPLLSLSVWYLRVAAKQIRVLVRVCARERWHQKKTFGSVAAVGGGSKSVVFFGGIEWWEETRESVLHIQNALSPWSTNGGGGGGLCSLPKA